MTKNEYIPSLHKIISITQQTELEHTFRVEYDTTNVKPGQFFEVSIPKFGEAPISISELGSNYLDLTVRKVGRVTGELFNYVVGDKLLMRGPYGNGFDIANFKGNELVVVAGGTGVSPVKPLIDHFVKNKSDVTSLSVVIGFKSTADILFKNDIETWKKETQVHFTLDKAEEGYTGNVGFIPSLVPSVKIQDPATTQVVVVGPPVMINATANEFLKLGIPEQNIWISLERRMACGIGKCGHCKIDDKYICIDGPVMRYDEGIKLVD